MTSSNGNIFRVTGPFWGECTGHRWITLTNASDTELCFLWSAPEQTVELTIETPVIWDAIALTMTSASVMPTFHNNLRWRAATDDKFGITTTLGFQCLSRQWWQIWHHDKFRFSISNHFHLQAMCCGHGPVSGQNWSTTKDWTIGVEAKHPGPIIEPGFVSTHNTALGWHGGRTATQEVWRPKTGTRKF